MRNKGTHRVGHMVMSNKIRTTLASKKEEWMLTTTIISVSYKYCGAPQASKRRRDKFNSSSI